MSERILIIDDESAVRRFLSVSLESKGYRVAEADSGRAGIQKAIDFLPELIVLDLGLPDMDGKEVLKALREWSRVPIVVLTVRDADEEKVAVLDGGADDYLTKPFSLAELLARVRVALRHARPDSDTPVARIGALEIDFAAHVVKLANQEVKLTATEYELLKILAQNSGKVVTQRQLLSQIWGPNAVEHAHYLRVYIGQLRKKIEADPASPNFILTEPGVGYRLKAQESEEQRG